MGRKQGIITVWFMPVNVRALSYTHTHTLHASTCRETLVFFFATMCYATGNPAPKACLWLLIFVCLFVCFIYLLITKCAYMPVTFDFHMHTCIYNRGNCIIMRVYEKLRFPCSIGIIVWNNSRKEKIEVIIVVFCLVGCRLFFYRHV